MTPRFIQRFCVAHVFLVTNEKNFRFTKNILGDLISTAIRASIIQYNKLNRWVRLIENGINRFSDKSLLIVAKTENGN